jgi:hypothetical protein
MHIYTQIERAHLRRIPLSTFSDFLDTLEEWETELFVSLNLLENPYAIAQSLQTTKIKGVSDGSVKFVCASFGWVMCSPDGSSAGQMLRRRYWVPCHIPG